MDTQNTIDRKGLSVKDLVTTGIFSALMLVFTMAGGMFFAANPILTFYMPMGCALLCGPVYLLLVAKVHKRWSITVLGVIVGFFFFVTGMHWSMALGNAGMGIIADITAGFGNYKNKKLNALSYMLFMLSNTFTYLIFFIDRDKWISAMLKKGTDASYIETMSSSATPWMPVLIVGGTLLVAAFSAWVGGKMLKKQFEKAGLV
ncbi:hypothetical protein HMPREF9194_02189 [Treponema maltophilum ATCC 51939]|uniref:TIGR02185 family protein n=1 Tax=Treponema maltophilum ATCC 51939 TaxID=1125699 RepID=S3L4V5_TREMA|nr:MptD family putative ECF transporter S component [Treponema maltophilum]EPF31834.1 hypothetical protein HMPREF9194_02189 [Treponema maltophilum ATCC 51939]